MLQQMLNWVMAVNTLCHISIIITAYKSHMLVFQCDVKREMGVLKISVLHHHCHYVTAAMSHAMFSALRMY